MAADAPAPRIAPPADWVKPATIQLPAAVQPGPDTAAIRNLLFDEQIKFGADSTSVYVEAISRAQTAQGLTAVGSIALPWNPDTQTLTVHKVRILRGDKVIDVLADHSFTVLRRETKLEQAMLDGSLTAALQVEDVEVGDTVDLAVTIDNHDPLLKGHSDLLVDAETPAPIDQRRLVASWADDREMRWRLGDGLPAAKIARSGAAGSFDLELKDVAPVAAPDGAPGRFSHARDIEFSDFTSWAQISALFAPLYTRAEALKAGSPLRAEAAKIAAASADPATRAAAALTLVEDEVRYVYLGMDAGGLTPADADATWLRRFGDCKGKTVLLIALLHELGIEAEPALVSTTLGDGLDRRLPTLGVFDHVIVRAIIGGKVYWLDGARAGDAALSLLRVPAYRWALPLSEPGSTLVPLTQIASSEPDGVTTLSLDASAGISQPAPARGEVVLHGDGAITVGLQFANLTADQRDQAMRTYWTKQYDFITVTKVADTFDRLTATERWTMQGSAAMAWEDGQSGQGKRYEADSVGLGWKADVKRQVGPHADAPYTVDFPEYDLTVESIVLPNRGIGFSVEGEQVDSAVAGRQFKRTAAIVNGVFTVRASQNAIAPEISADQAARDAKTLTEMAGQGAFVRAPSDYQMTEAEKSAAIAAQPKSAEDFIDQGVAFDQRGEGAKAVADYDKAIALDPTSALAYADRGFVKLDLGDRGAAEADDLKALALDAKDGVAQALAGARWLMVKAGSPMRSRPSARRSRPIRTTATTTAGVLSPSGRPARALSLSPTPPRRWSWTPPGMACGSCKPTCGARPARSTKPRRRSIPRSPPTQRMSLSWRYAPTCSGTPVG